MVFLIVTHLSLIKTGVIKKIPEAAEGVRNFLCKLVYSAGVFNATNNITA